MTRKMTEADFDSAVARAFGRGPDSSTMTVGEAAFDIAVAEAFGRAPSKAAQGVRDRVAAVQEAESRTAPWRAAAHWSQRESLIEAEEKLASLTSSRRGQTIESARAYVETLLRDAWAKSGASAQARMGAVLDALEAGIGHFERLAPLAPGQESAAGSVPSPVREQGR